MLSVFAMLFVYFVNIVIVCLLCWLNSGGDGGDSLLHSLSHSLLPCHLLLLLCHGVCDGTHGCMESHVLTRNIHPNHAWIRLAVHHHFVRILNRF